MACGILVLQPGVKPMPPEVEAWSFNPWTTREVPESMSTSFKGQERHVKHMIYTLLCHWCCTSQFERVRHYKAELKWWLFAEDACACVHAKLLSHVWLFGTPWTVARQAPLSMGFSRQKYLSGLPCPPPRWSSRPRDRTHITYVSCIGKRVLYH